MEHLWSDLADSNTYTDDITTIQCRSGNKHSTIQCHPHIVILTYMCMNTKVHNICMYIKTKLT